MRSTILLTGSSGFLGRFLQPALEAEGNVHTLGRGPACDIPCDLSQAVPILPAADAVVHAAGRAHSIPGNAAEAAAFFAVNTEGTRRLLEALEESTVRKFVFISSVSVYGLDWGEDIDEDTPLLGESPYAQSKIQAEQLVEHWCRTKGLDWLILRLPLVAGPNAPGNLGNMVRAISKGRYVRIGRAQARKSMVQAADVADLVARWLANPTGPSGIYHLTDGHHPSFFELEEAIRTHHGKSRLPVLPYWVGKLLARIGDFVPALPLNSNVFRKITRSLTFSDEKARRELEWKTDGSLIQNIFRREAPKNILNEAVS
ncbi:MAG: hypothetical protein RL386_191 [Bacteroidota bacterium]